MHLLDLERAKSEKKLNLIINKLIKKKVQQPINPTKYCVNAEVRL
ncbi:MAG: hypothetical protein ACI9V8_000991 [Urechidicola sp.]|jgi:hypothetical protein